MSKEKKITDLYDPLFWLLYRSEIDIASLNYLMPDPQLDYMTDLITTKYAIALISYLPIFVYIVSLREKYELIQPLKYPLYDLSNHPSMFINKYGDARLPYNIAGSYLEECIKRDLGEPRRVDLIEDVLPLLKLAKYDIADWLYPVLSFIAYGIIPLPPLYLKEGLKVSTGSYYSGTPISLIDNFIDGCKSLEEFKTRLKWMKGILDTEKRIFISFDRKLSLREFQIITSKRWKSFIEPHMESLPPIQFKHISMRVFMLGAHFQLQKGILNKSNDDLVLFCEDLAKQAELIFEKSGELDFRKVSKELMLPKHTVIKMEATVKKLFNRWIPELPSSLTQ